MLLLRLVFATTVIVALSACGANRYCVVEQEYQRAEMVPELQPAEGLTLPQSPSALKLPARPASFVPFGTLSDSGSGVCLDKPPAFVEPPEPAPSDTAPAKAG
ncbi:MAG: hypothetical protein ACT4QA_12245 [Panacagrimonas sp.]